MDKRQRWIKGVQAGTVAIVLAVLVSACGGGSDSDGGSGNGPLVIGAWGGAFNQATEKYYTKPFEQDGGPASQFVDAPGTQLARLEAQKRANNTDWDVIDSLAGAEAFVAYDKDLLEPLPSDLRSSLEETLGTQKVSEFGYTMANLGNVIVCNMDKMDTCPKNMAEFYDVDKFPQDRTVPGFGPLYLATGAMIANGTPVTETGSTPVDIDSVFGSLDELRPAIKVFWESGDQQEQLIRNGEVDMGILWSGRANRLAADGENIEIVWDGGVYEPGYMAVPKGAPNKEQAFDLLKWIAEHPQNQADWSEEMDYSVPSPKALELMPPENAAGLADDPKNFEQMGTPNWGWYVDNADELNQRFADFLKG